MKESLINVLLRGQKTKGKKNTNASRQTVSVMTKFLRRFWQRKQTYQSTENGSTYHRSNKSVVLMFFHTSWTLAVPYLCSHGTFPLARRFGCLPVHQQSSMHVRAFETFPKICASWQCQFVIQKLECVFSISVIVPDVSKVSALCSLMQFKMELAVHPSTLASNLSSVKEKGKLGREGTMVFTSHCVAWNCAAWCNAV